MKARRRISRRPWLEELETRLVPSITTSTNWSGYAVQANAGTVASVVGSWVVPTATGTGTAYSSTWVGIDGYTSSTVEQIGTDSDISGGKAVYYAWYEMYPSESVNLNLTVQPGDTISAQVSYGARGFTLQITDKPKNGGVSETFSTTQTAPGAQRSSAEWIEEAPSSNAGVLPLANFGTVSFSARSATIGGTTGAIDNSAWKSQVQQINMVSDRGATETTTGGLTDSGPTSSFSVSHVSNGSSAGGGSPSGGGSGHGHGGGWWGYRETDQSAQQTSLAAAVVNQSIGQASTSSQQTAAAQQSSLAAAVLNQAAQQAAATARDDLRNRSSHRRRLWECLPVYRRSMPRCRRRTRPRRPHRPVCRRCSAQPGPA